MTVQTADGASRTLEVRIPAGITDGTRLRAGDVILRVHLLPHPRFERSGRDLTTALAVPLTTAVLGGDAEVTTLSGSRLSSRCRPAPRAGSGCACADTACHHPEPPTTAGICSRGWKFACQPPSRANRSPTTRRCASWNRISRGRYGPGEPGGQEGRLLMNLNKFTEKAQEAIVAAPKLAASDCQPRAGRARAPAGDARRAGGRRRADRAPQARPAGPAPDGAGSARTSSARQPKAHGGAEPGVSPRLRVVLDAAQADATAMQDEFVSTEHLLLGHRRARAGRAPAAELLRDARRHPRARAREGPRRRCAAVQRVTDQNPGGQVPGAREVRPRPDRAGPQRASSTRSSAATRRSAASSRCCRGAPRTTRCSSASPASARRPSSRAWPSASCAATCPRASRTSGSSRSTWARWSPARSTAASSRSG